MAGGRGPRLGTDTLRATYTRDVVNYVWPTRATKGLMLVFTGPRPRHVAWLTTDKIISLVSNSQESSNSSVGCQQPDASTSFATSADVLRHCRCSGAQFGMSLISCWLFHWLYRRINADFPLVCHWKVRFHLTTMGLVSNQVVALAASVVRIGKPVASAWNPKEDDAATETAKIPGKTVKLRLSKF